MALVGDSSIIVNFADLRFQLYFIVSPFDPLKREEESNVYVCFQDARERVSRFQRRLEEGSMGVVTAGLAFHPHKSPVLRHPYHDPAYFERVRT